MGSRGGVGGCTGGGGGCYWVGGLCGKFSLGHSQSHVEINNFISKMVRQSIVPEVRESVQSHLLMVTSC